MARYRAWFIPAVPGEMFVFETESLREAALVFDQLAKYTLFLEDDLGLMDDYSNAGGVAEWDEEERDWFDVDDDEINSAL